MSLRKTTVLLGSVIALCLWFGDGAGTSGGRRQYIGSKKCASCHQIQYKGWVKTFHSTVVQDVRKNQEAILGDFSDPDLPFKKEDVHFTIGGHWDQRYMTKIGNDYFILPRTWSIQGKKWRAYSTYGWLRRPYSRYCVGCPSVGFDPKTSDITEHAVGCESCHGPGTEHVRSPSKPNIVNPSRLPEERSREICASCHVRGKDPSGDFHFPIGYFPGDNLAKFMIPAEKEQGEKVQDAIHRLWRKWQTDREKKSRSRCEVCGIHQTTGQKKEKSGVNSICAGCHDFADRQEKHTRHRRDVEIGCVDCHEQKDPEMNENTDENVHSYGYFLVHPQNCWDGEIHRKCVKCHNEKTDDWAFDVLMSWKEPVIVDH
jgi:hypothetical protein